MTYRIPKCWHTVRHPIVEALLYAVARVTKARMKELRCAKCDSQDVTVGRER